MEQAITSPLPMPAGTKLYMDTGQHLNAEDSETNFFQQMTGTIMYASLLRSELGYYASQLGKVMSAPTEAHMAFARKVLQYISGTIDDKHVFHPKGKAGFTDNDSDLAGFLRQRLGLCDEYQAQSRLLRAHVCWSSGIVSQ